CMIHIRAHLARGRKTQRRPDLQSTARPYLAAAGGGWWSRAPPDNGRRSPVRIVIDGNSLKLEQVAQAAAGGAHVEIAPAARERVRAARRLVDRIAESGVPTYGVNTGFCTLAAGSIGRRDLRQAHRTLSQS